MKRIHILLGIQSLLGILVSLNRLGPWTLGYVLPNEFLRWVDLNNIIISLISLVALYLLKKTIEYNSPEREGSSHTTWNFVFIKKMACLATVSAEVAGKINRNT